MQLARAQDLAEQAGMVLKQGFDYNYDLYDPNGNFVDDLNPIQIGEMKEEDFISYYLKDFIVEDED